ncbi:glucosamine 6-phosphate N-acetyltransferase [Panaeolus papilionaceus]|nr:glucosamine 6-phosphate N-acetyltransferase [Panaeolus papilionaceus]
MPSAFTPDSQLDLLFNPELIPNDVQAQLGSDLHLRPLARCDLKRNHLGVLAVLTSTPNLTEEQYQRAFDVLRSCNNTYYTIVIVAKETDSIVGVGTVFMEQKFTRNLGRVGHIEDIAVDKNVQGKKLGLRVIQALTGISEKTGCYKTILNCSDHNIPFYEKCGFEKKENEMARYHNVATPAPPMERVVAPRL